MPINPEKLYRAKELADLLQSIKPEPDTCWIWPYARASSGYGHVQYAGNRTTVHRAVFHMINGRWPQPLTRHTCDNRACFNPLHLIEGTHLDNVMDSIERGTFIRGEDSKVAKLTENMVRDIRVLYYSGRRTGELAKEFNISAPTICDIVARRTWRHI